MSKSHDSTRFRVRRSPRHLSQRRRLQVEALECRALLAVSFTGGFGIGGRDVDLNAVTTDASGDVFVTGEYSGAANFGSGYAPNNTPNGSNTDAFVAEYSSAGAVKWYTEFYNESSDSSSKSSGESLAYDAANSTVYVVGNFSGTVDFNNFPGSSHLPETASFDSSSGDDDSDPYIVALNASNGHATDFDDFAQTFNETISVTSSQVTVNPAGDSVYVTGFYSGGSITVSDNSGNDTTFRGSNEGFTLKFGASNFSLSPNANDWAVTTWNDSDGPLDGALNFGVTPTGSATGVDYVVGDDVAGHQAFVEELNDQDGSLDNLVEFGTDDTSSTSVVFATGVVTDSVGNAYVVGTFSGDLETPSQGAANLISSGATNAFIMKFDTSLNYKWGDRFGSLNNVINGNNVGDDANIVGIDKSGNLYMAGQIGGPSDFGTNTSTNVVGQNSNNEEAYVIEVSSTGTFTSGVAATGTGTSEADDLAVSSNGQVAATGSIVSPASLGSHQPGPNDLVFFGTLSAGGGGTGGGGTGGGGTGGGGTGGGGTGGGSGGGGGSTTPTPTPPPTPTPVTPVFIGEQRVYSGRGKHKKLVGFELQFSGALNGGTAQQTGLYQVLQKNNLRVNSASYNPATSSSHSRLVGSRPPSRPRSSSGA